MNEFSNGLIELANMTQILVNLSHAAGCRRLAAAVYFQRYLNLTNSHHPKCRY